MARHTYNDEELNYNDLLVTYDGLDVVVPPTETPKLKKTDIYKETPNKLKEIWNRQQQTEQNI